jgi:hypothetical protein
MPKWRNSTNNWKQKFRNKIELVKAQMTNLAILKI